MTVDAQEATPAPLTTLPEADAQWREKVRAFAEKQVRTRAAEMDAAMRMDADLIAELFSAGLMGVEIPQRYGGAGGSLFQTFLTIEELARVDPAVAVLADVQNALINSALLRHGTGDQKRRLLPRLATGTVGAFSLSEDAAGSDAFALTTSAERKGGEFVLNGRKQWTTSGAEAGLFVVFARTAPPGDGPPHLTAFLVDAESEGLTVGERIGKLGIRASSTCPLVLKDVRVRRQDVLGRVGEANVLGVEALTIGKIGIAAQLVGLARGALDAALDYARERRQFGEPIAGFQGVRFPLAALAAEIEAARLLVYNAARMAERGDTPGELIAAAAMAKLFASEVAERTASHAVETFGGNGFTTAHPVEKFYRDVKVGKIYEGTTNMQLRTISAALLRARTEGPAA